MLNKILFLAIAFSLTGCINTKKETSENSREESIHVVQTTAALNLDKIQYIDWDGKEYIKEVSLIESIQISFNPNHRIPRQNLDGLEQLVNLKKLWIIGGEYLAAIDLSPISSMYNLEELSFSGSITRLPDLSRLEKLREIEINNSRLENLEGIGAPNVRRISIYSNLATLNSFAGLSNMPHLEYINIGVKQQDSNTIYNIADMTNLPSLKKIDIDTWAAKINLQGIEKLKALEKIIIESEAFNFEGIGKLNNLISLSMPIYVPEPSLEFLRDIPNLSELFIWGVLSDSNYKAAQILDVSPIATLKKLSVLQCRHFILKNAASLNDILEGIPYADFIGSRFYNENEQASYRFEFFDIR